MSEFKKSLGLKDATLIVAGSMIGSGIFIVSADIMRNLGSGWWLLAVWVITGFMTLTAALSYGELSAMFPKAGGQFVYLKEAFNPLAGFLYGWSFFTVIQTGTIAAVAMAFAKYSAVLFPGINEQTVLLKIGDWQFNSVQALAIISIIVLTFISTRGVETGKLIQSIFTIAKFAAIIGLIVLGFVLVKNSFLSENLSGGWQAFNTGKDKPINWQALTGTALMGGIAAAMVGSIFSSDAWNNVTFIAGEIKKPERNIPLSLFFGTLLVTVVYLLCNVMYLTVLNNNAIASAPNDRVATVVANTILGENGAYWVAAMIMISTFGCNNGLIMAGARVYYSMAKDGLFFKQAGQLNKAGVPSNSLWMQCIWACLLCLSGKYGDLLDYVAFIVVLFYILTIIGLFRLRVTQPNTERPYKAFGYPVLPIIYILMALAFCVLLFIYKPVFTQRGLIIALAGIPVYYIIQYFKKAK
jgi:basic amino acid/polyamine antiporter, APA family